jgi:hypothetical protein
LMPPLTSMASIPSASSCRHTSMLSARVTPRDAVLGGELHQHREASPNRPTDLLVDTDQGASALLGRAAPLVLAPVGARGEELVDEVAEGSLPAVLTTRRRSGASAG